MTMTKQHFVALARALYETRPTTTARNSAPLQAAMQNAAEISQWATTVRAMADVCAAFNAQFKRAAFYDACGYTAAYGRT